MEHIITDNGINLIIGLVVTWFIRYYLGKNAEKNENMYQDINDIKIEISKLAKHIEIEELKDNINQLTIAINTLRNHIDEINNRGCRWGQNKIEKWKKELGIKINEKN